MTLSICTLFGTKRYWLLSLPSQGKLVHARLVPKFSQTMFFIFADVAISYLVAAKCATRYVLNRKKASTDTVSIGVGISGIHYCGIVLASFPGPCPAFHHLLCSKLGDFIT